VTRDEAKKAVLEEIRRGYKGQEEIVVDEVHTMTKPYGWVFFYNTKRYIERREVLHALGGNGPVVVEGATGRITKLGTARPVDDEIADFELRHGYQS
jgi:hypothetical protein